MDVNAAIIFQDKPNMDIATTNDAVAVWRIKDDSPASVIAASTFPVSTNIWTPAKTISPLLTTSSYPLVKTYTYGGSNVTAVAVWITSDPVLDTMIFYSAILQDLDTNSWSPPIQVSSTTTVGDYRDYELEIDSNGNVFVIRSDYDFTMDQQVILVDYGTIDTSASPVTINWTSETPLE